MPTLAFFGLGLAGEVGEVVEKIFITPKGNKEVALELGDALWYLSGTYHALGFKLANCVPEGLQKENQMIMAHVLDLQVRVSRYLEHIKKFYRDDNGILNEDRRRNLVYHGGLVFEAIVQVSWGMGFTVEQIMDFNNEKIEGRILRGTQYGEGDNR